MEEEQFSFCIDTCDKTISFVFLMTIWLTRLRSVDIRHALCLYYAIHWVYDIQLQNDDFELDLEKVLVYFQKDIMMSPKFGSMIWDCKHY